MPKVAGTFHVPSPSRSYRRQTVVPRSYRRQMVVPRSYRRQTVVRFSVAIAAMSPTSAQ